MPCQSNNATPPEPAIAPGVESIDPAQVARTFTIDPRIPALVPGFDAPFFQAGLAGYSDAAMRIIARRHGCPYCVTEALLDRTLLGGGKGFAKANLENLADNVPGGAEDHPLAGQIMGSDPNEMAAAAVKLIEQAKRPAHEYRKIRERGFDAAPEGKAVEPSKSNRSFSTIDVNLACPVKKIKAKARGGHWLREPDGAIDILRAVRHALPLEINTTVKLRRGSDDSPQAAQNFDRIFNAAYDLGYAWTTVHARTVEQKYVGPSRWTFLKDLTARHPDKIIFASGDIWQAEDIFRMIAFTGIHAVAVARGCIGNPWIFQQARQLMTGIKPEPPTIAEQRQVLEDHFRLSVAVNGEALAGRLMRKFGIRFSAHHPTAEAVRVEFIKVNTTDEWLTVLNEHYTA